MTKIVNLVSGGLDSTLVGILNKELGNEQFPLFIDYGQRAKEIEWSVCRMVHEKYLLPQPIRLDISGFGNLIKTGLTSSEKDIVLDAFTPGRNLIFLVMASSYAFQMDATAVSIGLLSEQFSLFPDQTSNFIFSAEQTINIALGKKINIITPLSSFSKADIVEIAKKKGITGTYSCHEGSDVPCGKCISCKEYLN